MGRRLQLHSLLKEISEHAYFQDPPNLLMEYPCVRYEPDSANAEFADNSPYRYTQRYLVTVIDSNPDSLDSGIAAKVAALPMCTMNRYFSKEQLHHFVFNLYF